MTILSGSKSNINSQCVFAVLPLELVYQIVSLTYDLKGYSLSKLANRPRFPALKIEKEYGLLSNLYRTTKRRTSPGVARDGMFSLEWAVSFGRLAQCGLSTRLAYQWWKRTNVFDLGSTECRSSPAAANSCYRFGICEKENLQPILCVRTILNQSEAQSV